MTASPFNALAAARDLKAAGIEAEPAEAIAGAVHPAAAERGDRATKADLEPLATQAELRTAIADLKADMLKMAIGVVIANATLTADLVFGALRLLRT